MPGTGFPKLGATAASVPSRNSVPCSPVTAGPASRSRWAQAWHLGLCDYQVPGDLESSNEGTELNLLVGANRESVPKRNQTKGKNREYHGQENETEQRRTVCCRRSAGNQT